jgi:hypothetical protein
MKKLKLNLQYLENAELLTRAQLKTILGGEEGSGGEPDAVCNSNACTYKKEVTDTIWTNGTCKAMTGMQTGCGCAGLVLDTACNKT